MWPKDRAKMTKSIQAVSKVNRENPILQIPNTDATGSRSLELCEDNKKPIVARSICERAGPERTNDLKNTKKLIPAKSRSNNESSNLLKPNARSCNSMLARDCKSIAGPRRRKSETDTAKSARAEERIDKIKPRYAKSKTRGAGPMHVMPTAKDAELT